MVGVPLFLANFPGLLFSRAAAGKNVNSAAGDGSSATGDVIIVGTAVLGIIVAVAVIIAVIIDAGAPARRREEGHCKVCARDA
jgi:hypothetical protein